MTSTTRSQLVHDLSAGRGSKISSGHLDRLAVVYVRQSTPQQVLAHGESTRLQYGLVSRAEAYGWASDRMLVIDDDLGKSGTTAVGRAGFERLVTEVSLGHVGLILGLEMSRLARSNVDWRRAARSLRALRDAHCRPGRPLRSSAVERPLITGTQRDHE